MTCRRAGYGSAQPLAVDVELAQKRERTPAGPSCGLLVRDSDAGRSDKLGSSDCLTLHIKAGLTTGSGPKPNVCRLREGDSVSCDSASNLAEV